MRYWSFLVIIFTLSGRSRAEADCSYEASRECGEVPNDWKGETFPENVRELDKACRGMETLDCMIAFAERCPKSLAGMFLGYMQETKELQKRLCTKMDDFRMEYLENVPCLNKHLNRLFAVCRPVFSGKLKEVCKKNSIIRRCVAEGVSNNCGSAGRRVFDVVYKPALAIDDFICARRNLK